MDDRGALFIGRCALAVLHHRGGCYRAVRQGVKNTEAVADNRAKAYLIQLRSCVRHLQQSEADSPCVYLPR